MAYTINITQSQLLTVLKAFLQSLTGFANTEVVQGQYNRVPSPKAANYIVFTPIGRYRQSTNTVSYNSSNNTVLNQQAQTQSTRLDVQVDCYGPSSPDMAQIIATEFRSTIATDYFNAAGFDRAPLYTSEPRQLPFHDEGNQVQIRWSLDLSLEYDPTVTSSQQFADSLSIGIKNVDVEYPAT